ncbi:MAG: hypothetical protein WD010_00555, partial [Nitriliruptor sp.]
MSDQPTPDEATPDEATPDEATPDEATPDEATPDQTPDPVVADQPATTEPAGEGERHPAHAAPGAAIALTERYGVPNVGDIDIYEQHGGYVGLRKALEMDPKDIIETVKEAGVRGRGGAGFPTGLKWSFVAQDTGKPIYIVC